MAERADLSFHRTYTLLAQTPMIHFQPTQSGAALRASEVKPKLDRYLFRQYGKEIPKNWRMAGQPTALNYQLRLLPLGGEKPGKPHISQCKAYFGNMGGGDQMDLVYRDLRLEINCFIPELLEFLDAQIGSFFVLQNFGTRQTKGFGGFLIREKTDEDQAGAIIRQNCPHFFYADLPRNISVADRLNDALAVYNFLKTGTNQTRYRDGFYQFPKRYIKGYALRAFLPRDVGGDKAFIKANVVPSKISRPMERTEPYPSYTFIRALLGLADHYDFRDDMRGKETVNIVHFEGTEVRDGRLYIPEESIRDSLGIKRFPSPILIKVFRNRIYFILNDSWKLMLSKTFLMMKKFDYKDATAAVKAKRFRDAQRLFQNAHHIRTPDSFDPEEFLSGFVAYFNKNRGVLAEFPKNEKCDEGMMPGVYYTASTLRLEMGGRQNG